MRKILIVIPLLFFAMAAPSTGTMHANLKPRDASPGQKPGAKMTLPLSDAEILKKVYEESYKTPPGFYQDPALKDPNRSLYFHQPGWYSREEKEAFKLVEDFLKKPSNIQDRKVEETRKTNIYYDFRAGSIWYRIHNPDYFIPKGERIDSAIPLGQIEAKPALIGVLKLQPVTPDIAKELAEYLWLIRFYNLGGAKVLASVASKDGKEVVARIYTTQVVYGDFGLQDEITVCQETYRINPTTGAVTRSQEVVRRLTGKRN
ncbi:MAG: hypothetical protein AB7P49_16450 [Bdellovibrionales bacterium]